MLNLHGSICFLGSTEGLCCVRLNMIRAHQQPISVLECDGRRILTGSQDHTIKVSHYNQSINQ